MKPMGPIPAGFAAIEGELAIGGRKAGAWLAEAGDGPLFVYSGAMIAERVALLRRAMPRRLHLDYAVKANPFGPVLALLAGLVDGFDIASAGELALVQGQAIAADRLAFAGPGKRDAELHAAIAAGVVLHCESASEVERALTQGEALGIAPRLALRVNPDFELGGAGMRMGGGARPFGIDWAQVPALARRVIASGCDWQGLHIYAGSQSLDGPAIGAALCAAVDLAEDLAGQTGTGLARCSLGGGLGIPYYHGQVALDPAPIGALLGERLDRLPPAFAATRFAIELGRYLVGEAGVYLTRIVDRKESHGATFLVTDGGLHHVLAASGQFGAVVRRNYPCALANRFGGSPQETVSVVGCLCTPLDRLADQVLLPVAEVGDVVALFCCGAYGASASPAAFLGQGPAHEILAP